MVVPLCCIAGHRISHSGIPGTDYYVSPVRSMYICTKKVVSPRYGVHTAQEPSARAKEAPFPVWLARRWPRDNNMGALRDGAATGLAGRSWGATIEWKGWDGSFGRQMMGARSRTAGGTPGSRRDRKSKHEERRSIGQSSSSSSSGVSSDQIRSDQPSAGSR